MTSILKKIVSITILLLFAVKSFAPGSESLVIIHFDPLEPYERLIHAIGMVETKYDTLAYNQVEMAAGYFQIRPIRLIDYNKRTGSYYTRKDLFNYKVSEKIFLYYASQIGPYDLEQIARKWNGSGRNTIYYWSRVKKYL